jgi:predicted nucleic acid-binding protein
MIDTDVLIEYLRGSDRAAKFLEGLEGDLIISAISVAELFSGVKGSAEMDALDQFMLAFQTIPIDDRLARQAGLIRQEYHPRHGVGLADALIAATALEEGAELFTFNRRHYPMVKDVSLPYNR